MIEQCIECNSKNIEFSEAIGEMTCGDCGLVLMDKLIEEKTFSFEPELTIKFAKNKCKFFEVPITYNGRSYEEGKKIGLKDAFIALKTIILYSFKS